MSDELTLNTPIVISSISGYTLRDLYIGLSPASTVVVTLVGTNGGLEVFQYPSPEGTQFDTVEKVGNLITALNTANLSTRSLKRRLLDRLLLDFPDRFLGGGVVQ